MQCAKMYVLVAFLILIQSFADCTIIHLRRKIFSRLEAKSLAAELDTISSSRKILTHTNATHEILSETDIAKVPRISKKLCTALIQYYQEYKTTDIQRDYVVPLNDKQSWPKWLRGFELGNALSTYMSKGNVGRISLGGNMPAFHLVDKYPSDKLSVRRSSNRTALSASRKQKYTTYSFSTFTTAVSIYKSLHNDSLVIPNGWTVPPCDPWPESCWGMPLGPKVIAARSGHIYHSEKKVAALDAIGFDWNPGERAEKLVLTAMNTYRDVHGDLGIARDYVIPTSESFPRELWGMKLGLKVNNIRYRGDRPRVRENLEQLGFSLGKVGFDTRHWDYVYKALVIFKDLEGHIDVPRIWQVPNEEPWPSELWGLKLGYRVHNIRYRGDFVLQREECGRLLDELGFRWKRKA